MGNMGRFDLSGLREFNNRLQHLSNPDQFAESCAKELAARLLRLCIKRTPVGVYPSGSGKTGGTLRRGWTNGNQASPQGYAESIAVQHVGNVYKIDIINPVEYASYVEYGHRQQPGRFVPAIGKRLVYSWVHGRFMMTISEQELESIAPQILERRIQQYMRGLIR